ncbi:MAG TPA: leucyl aminopeptidase family protein [Phycisphaerales bacterium]|nr:leucyl aminopeptidase family protein [Phycisphaerales bacterium]
MFEAIRFVEEPTTTTLVLGQFKGRPLDERSARLDKTGAALAASKRPEATGDRGSITEAHPAGGYERVLVVGLGDIKNADPGTLRSVGAMIARRLAAVKATSAHIDLSAPIAEARINPVAAGNGLGEGIGLVGWVCDQFRGKATTLPKRTALDVSCANKQLARGLERGLALARSTNYTRTLSQTPPNVATPEWIAQQAQKLAKECGLAVKTFKGDDLEKERFEGLINVGKASENKPCMIRLEYKPEKAPRNNKPLVLIGKTMTYDTGGLSLKVNNSMVGMKRDKDGGCAVLGAMHAIATAVRPARRVVALLAVAENSISDEAYRPDDVLTYRNGVTVEVTNTDAEGRLVLADALCWACEKEDPAAIVDIATLTGGVITALGSTFAGMFCDDERLLRQVEAASAASGERVWRLPMHEEYRDMMKSPIADIVNSNPNRKAHAGQGAAFLSYFVKEGIPWCHLDIAGVHVAEKNAGLYVEGPTGWGVRILASLAAQ